MSTSVSGLRKISTFEEMLQAALKQEKGIAGIIAPELQRSATRIINSPEFQRVKDRLEDDLVSQEKLHMERRNFENNVTNLSVEAKINRSDLQHIISNLQQPPAPPAPPPVSTHAAADRERLLAELDGMAMEREQRMRQEFIASQNAQNLAAQRSVTPAQQIINHFHSPQSQPQPIYVQDSSMSDAMRAFGMSFRELFLAQQQEPRRRDEIPIQYLSSGGGGSTT